MLIKIAKSWEIPEIEATPEHLFLNRRALLAGAGAIGGALALPSLAAAEDPSAGLYPAKRNEAYKLDRAVTPEKVNANYNNFYEFGMSKNIVDGAAAILIGSEAAGKTHGFVPRARIVAAALSGADPTIMLTGPMPAARKALAKAGMTIEQIDLFEVNEAFAAVPMRFMKEMGVPHEKVNVNGGAIAMGHPLGATGAMILNTLIDELHRRKLRYGLATLCVGGGMGIATIVERV